MHGLMRTIIGSEICFFIGTLIIGLLFFLINSAARALISGLCILNLEQDIWDVLTND